MSEDNIRKPGEKVAVLRVENVPITTDQRTLEENLRRLAQHVVPDVKDAVSRLRVRSIAARDLHKFSATISLRVSIQKDELCRALEDALECESEDLGYRFDSMFRGITPLSEPNQSSGACDVIAVPGLSSHPVGSWISRGSKDMWLRDWLPKDLPNVRVLLYGYNTELLQNESRESLQDLARGLLESLGSFRSSTNTSTRPTIFIGHSLGGILAKEALVQSFKSPDTQPLYKPIYQRCRGVIFFGVPHLGIRNESLSAVVKGQPNEVLIDSIVVDNESEPSHYLRRLSDDFAECFQGARRVMSWYERVTSPLVEIRDGRVQPAKDNRRLLVTKTSATRTGLTSVPEENNIPSPSDHSGLVKFAERHDTSYVSVREKIKLWLQMPKPMSDEGKAPTHITSARSSESTDEDDELLRRGPRAVHRITQGGNTYNGDISAGGGSSITMGSNNTSNVYYR